MVALSQEQRDFFQRHRYVVVPNLFDAQTIAAVSRWTDELVSWPEEPGRHMVYYEDDSRQPGNRVLSRIENFVPYHSGLSQLVQGEKVLGAIAQLLGEPCVLFKEKINFKLPGGEGFRWHQDVQAGWDAYGSIHLTLMVSIDPSNRENGCLQMAHGFQGRELLGPKWAPMDEDRLEPFQLKHCSTQPGDAIFFDSFVPHGSEQNRTDSPRRILYLTYGLAAEGDHRVRYYQDKRKNYPPDVEREEGKEYIFKV